MEVDWRSLDKALLSCFCLPLVWEVYLTIKMHGLEIKVKTKIYDLWHLKCTYLREINPAFYLILCWVWQIFIYSCAHPNWNLRTALELLGFAIVIIHDGERLLVAGLVDVLAHVRPVQPKGLGVSVTAGQELQGHPAEADLCLLEKTLTPRGQFVQLGKDKAGLPVGMNDMW